MKKTAFFITVILVLQIALTFTACASYEANTGTINLSTMEVTGDGITTAENKITITGGGDFTVTGENSNAMIYVNADDKVKLRLSGISLKNESGPAIFFENVQKALITIADNTKNYIEDGTAYGDIDAKAALFSNDDLEIKGNGTLYVTGNYKHAIASDDDISIENGTINITANIKDGIHVNNTFSMSGGSLNISATSDGIQAEQDVIIDGGTINIAKCEEGIESGTSITINDGEINITSSDDGLNSGGGTGSGNEFGGFGNRGNMPNDQAMERPSEGNMPQRGQMPPQNGQMPERKNNAPQNMPSDLQNPDNTFANSTGVNTDTQNTDKNIYINGGVIKINASGDGVDSNSSIYMTGGELYVDGPTSNGDGAIDGNSFDISGGTVLAIGSSGMATGASNSSEQCAFNVSLTEIAKADSEIKIINSDGDTIEKYTAAKDFSSIVYSSSKLKQGETYSVCINDETVQTVEMTSMQVSVGNNKNNFGNRGEKPFGNMHNGQNSANGMPSGRKIKVYLNNEEMNFDSSPVIIDDTTLVPLRTIFESLGMTVDWNDETQTVTATKGDTVITMTIGNKEASVNNKKTSLLAAPVLSKENRTLVPVRFIAESLNYDVQWNESTNSVYIS